MNRYQRILGALALACAVLAPAERRAAAQSWYGYGGAFGTRTYYTYYAPPAVLSGYAAAPAYAYYYPAVVVSQPIVGYSAARVIVPTSAYAPLTAACAPATSCRPVVSFSAGCGQYCGTVACAPAMLAPSVAAPISFAPAPAPTIVTPTVPRFGTPIYPPPGVYPQAPAATPVYPYQPQVSPGSPTSSVSPADQPPTMSGYPPMDYGAYAPRGTGAPARVAPSAPNSGDASPSSETGTDSAPRNNRLRPDLDISVPANGDEALTPVKPTDASNQKDDAAAGPRLEGDDGHTASVSAPHTGLLSPATWRAVRPSSRRALADRKSAIRPNATP